jgi:lysyl-tRNA synthetase class 2
MDLDEVFLRAMEFGMPPAGGIGIGVDRLLGMLTGSNLRETILFPLLRPE